MAHAMAGSKVKDVPVAELEFGVEDGVLSKTRWTGSRRRRARRRVVRRPRPCSASPPTTNPRTSSACTASSSPRNTRIVTRMPLSRRFNAIKEAYELMSDRGGQSGATFEGLGDKAKRDFVKLDGVHAGVSSKDGAGGVDAGKVTVALVAHHLRSHQGGVHREERQSAKRPRRPLRRKGDARGTGTRSGGGGERNGRRVMRREPTRRSVATRVQRGALPRRA